MENNIVRVSLWGQTVGEIYWDEKRKQSLPSIRKLGKLSLVRDFFLMNTNTIF